MHVGRYPIEENCSCFYICDKTGRQMNAKVFKCPGTSVYSPVNKKCCYSPRIAPTQVSSTLSLCGIEGNSNMNFNILGSSIKCIRRQCFPSMRETWTFPVIRELCVIAFNTLIFPYRFQHADGLLEILHLQC